MKKLALLALAAFLLSACQEQFQDLDTNFYADPRDIREDYPVLVTTPDSLTIYKNADGFPNVAVMCIKGIPFTGTSSTHQGGLRQVMDNEGAPATAICDPNFTAIPPDAEGVSGGGE